MIKIKAIPCTGQSFPQVRDAACLPENDLVKKWLAKNFSDPQLFCASGDLFRVLSSDLAAELSRSGDQQKKDIKKAWYDPSGSIPSPVLRISRLSVCWVFFLTGSLRLTDRVETAHDGTSQGRLKHTTVFSWQGVRGQEFY